MGMGLWALLVDGYDLDMCGYVEDIEDMCSYQNWSKNSQFTLLTCSYGACLYQESFINIHFPFLTLLTSYLILGCFFYVMVLVGNSLWFWAGDDHAIAHPCGLTIIGGMEDEEEIHTISLCGSSYESLLTITYRGDILTDGLSVQVIIC